MLPGPMQSIGYGGIKLKIKVEVSITHKFFFFFFFKIWDLPLLYYNVSGLIESEELLKYLDSVRKS